MEKKLDGQVILVTGAGRGLGVGAHHLAGAAGRLGLTARQTVTGAALEGVGRAA